MAKAEAMTVGALRHMLDGLDDEKNVFLSVDDEGGETTLHAPLMSVIAHEDYDYDFIELVTVNEGGEWDTDG